MDITLINWTTNEIDTVYSAAKLCTNKLDYWENIVESIKISDKIKKKLIQIIVESGHHSVLEHINLTFGISGISRASGRQLLRSRIASFTEKSQRYVEMDDICFIKPESISRNSKTNLAFDKLMADIQNMYDEMIELGIPKEDARFILPNATPTDMVITLNFRELMHICSGRLCTKAQWEIRGVVEAMKEEVEKCLGKFWSDMLVPKCVSLGKCNEKKSCGYINK